MRRTTAVLTWLHENPGFHRPVAVAHGLGIQPHEAAATLIHLDEQGRVSRFRQEGRPKSVYAWKEGVDLPIE